jgi:hypothetical protein
MGPFSLQNTKQGTWTLSNLHVGPMGSTRSHLCMYSVGDVFSSKLPGCWLSSIRQFTPLASNAVKCFAATMTAHITGGGGVCSCEAKDCEVAVSVCILCLWSCTMRYSKLASTKCSIWLLACVLRHNDSLYVLLCPVIQFLRHSSFRHSVIYIIMHRFKIINSAPVISFGFILHRFFRFNLSLIMGTEVPPVFLSQLTCCFFIVVLSQVYYLPLN